eukprot:2068110-Pyramimonas_sp.AAC.2
MLQLFSGRGDGADFQKKKKRGPKSQADIKKEKARDRMFLRHIEDVEREKRVVGQEGQSFIERYRSGHSQKVGR